MKSKSDVFDCIVQHFEIFEAFEHVYLFGSSIDQHVIHNDIDILVIYSEYSELVKCSLGLLCDVLGKSVDLTALSIEEENEIAFLDRIKPRYIRIK